MATRLLVLVHGALHSRSKQPKAGAENQQPGRASSGGASSDDGQPQLRPLDRARSARDLAQPPPRASKQQLQLAAGRGRGRVGEEIGSAGPVRLPLLAILDVLHLRAVVVLD